jgi:hypothetical protein
MFHPYPVNITSGALGTTITSQKQYDISCRLRQTLLALVLCNNVTPIQEEISKKVKIAKHNLLNMFFAAVFIRYLIKHHLLMKWLL